MEPIPTWEANSSPAGQEIPRSLWNPIVHYDIHQSPPPVLARSMQSILLHSNSCKSILILSSYVRLDLPSSLFPSVLPTKTLYSSLRHTWHMLGQSHPPLFVNQNSVLRKAQFIKPLITEFASVSLTPEYVRQHPTFKHPQPIFLPHFHRPSLTLIKNNRHNYSSLY